MTGTPSAFDDFALTARATPLAAIVADEIRDGVVSSVVNFGAFVDLGGMDGLVHVSELSWQHVSHPSEVVSVGDKVKVKVLEVDLDRERISLSIRRLQPDPWSSTVADLKVGDVIEGAVTKIVNFGAFVRVREGLEGLIHISELSHQRVAHPGDVVHEGQTLKLRIISLDSERHRLGLSLKQAEEPPVRPAPEPGVTPAAENSPAAPDTSSVTARARSAKPLRAMFSAAMADSSGSISTKVTLTPGTRDATARPAAPTPAPRSATRSPGTASVAAASRIASWPTRWPLRFCFSRRRPPSTASSVSSAALASGRSS